MHHTHDGIACDGEVWFAEGRCVKAAHRIETAGRAPCQTRSLPPVLWPFEIAGRIEARLRGWLHRNGRLPL